MPDQIQQLIDIKDSIFNAFKNSGQNWEDFKKEVTGEKPISAPGSKSILGGRRKTRRSRKQGKKSRSRK